MIMCICLSPWLSHHERHDNISAQVHYFKPVICLAVSTIVRAAVIEKESTLSGSSNQNRDFRSFCERVQLS